MPDEIKQFYEKELKLKKKLIYKINCIFDTYKKDVVRFYPKQSEEELEYSRYFDFSYAHLMRDFNFAPLWINSYDIIDTNLQPIYIKKEEDGELRLYLSEDDDDKYLSLSEPEWGLSVKDLYGLTKLLTNDLIKRLNS